MARAYRRDRFKTCLYDPAVGKRRDHESASKNANALLWHPLFLANKNWEKYLAFYWLQ